MARTFGLALKLALLPLLLTQAVATRRRALILPEAAGSRSGRLPGKGRPLRLLIAGDSSAAGVGVDHQQDAFAGQLARALRQRIARPLQWTLHARSGLTTQQVHQLLRAQPQLQPVDIAVIVSGVNDVLDRIAPRDAVRHRAALADWLLAEGRSQAVVFCPLPPVHRFPLLPQPLKRVLGDEARAHDAAMAHWAAGLQRVWHVPIALDLRPEAMARDGFHPGEPVYRACGEAIAAHVAAQLRETDE